MTASSTSTDIVSVTESISGLALVQPQSDDRIKVQILTEFGEASQMIQVCIYITRILN